MTTTMIDAFMTSTQAADGLKRWQELGGHLEVEGEHVIHGGDWQFDMAVPRSASCRIASGLEFRNVDEVLFFGVGSGPINQGHLVLRRWQQRGADLRFLNPNDCDLEAKVTWGNFVVGTDGERAQAEFNRLRPNVVHGGVHFIRGVDSWGSLRGTDLRAKIFGGVFPFRIQNMSLYNSTAWVEIGTHKPRSDVATVCLENAGLHNTKSVFMIEGGSPIACAWTPYVHPDGTRLSRQAILGLHLIHAHPVVGIFNDIQENLPHLFTATPGANGNGNRTRPTWTCTDGEVDRWF